MSAGSMVVSVLNKAWGARLPSGSRTGTQWIGITGVPGLYHEAASDVVSSVLPSTWPYHADAMILAHVVAGWQMPLPLFRSAL